MDNYYKGLTLRETKELMELYKWKNNFSKLLSICKYILKRKPRDECAVRYLKTIISDSHLLSNVYGSDLSLMYLKPSCKTILGQYPDFKSNYKRVKALTHFYREDHDSTRIMRFVEEVIAKN